MNEATGQVVEEKPESIIDKYNRACIRIEEADNITEELLLTILSLYYETGLTVEQIVSATNLPSVTINLIIAPREWEGE